MSATATTTKVRLVRRTADGIAVRLPDGSERNVHGGKVSLVYCSPSDLDAEIKQTEGRQVNVSLTMTESGSVLCFGEANWI